MYVQPSNQVISHGQQPFSTGKQFLVLVEEGRKYPHGNKMLNWQVQHLVPCRLSCLHGGVNNAFPYLEDAELIMQP